MEVAQSKCVVILRTCWHQFPPKSLSKYFIHTTFISFRCDCRMNFWDRARRWRRDSEIDPAMITSFSGFPSSAPLHPYLLSVFSSFVALPLASLPPLFLYLFTSLPLCHFAPLPHFDPSHLYLFISLLGMAMVTMIVTMSMAEYGVALYSIG